MLTELSKRKGFKLRLLIAPIALVSLFAGEACLADKDFHKLPKPGFEADSCLNTLLRQRRTSRAFASRALSLTEVAQLLWAAQGITSREGYRTAPSAGALYPLELHLVVGNIKELPSGSYRYDPEHHILQTAMSGDIRHAIAEAALNQDWIAQAPAVVVVSAVDSRTTRKYGRRGVRYVHMEVGHASQNLLLKAVALGLGGAIVGAFDDDRLKRLLRLPTDEHPLAILPVGHPR